MQNAGKILIIVGGIIIFIGFLMWLAGDKLSWLGRLPGDIRIETENFRLYIPITTMVLVSIFITLIIRIINKIL